MTMPELENELHNILEDFANSRANDYELHQSTEHTYWQSIAAIEKAFRKHGIMTGQEWYDKFKQEFAADKSVSFNGDLLAVARKAAGIE